METEDLHRRIAAFREQLITAQPTDAGGQGTMHTIRGFTREQLKKRPEARAAAVANQLQPMHELSWQQQCELVQEGLDLLSQP